MEGSKGISIPNFKLAPSKNVRIYALKLLTLDTSFQVIFC